MDLLKAATKDKLFQFDWQLYEQVDEVAMGSPLGPLLANVFTGSVEETLEREGRMPSFYKRYVDDKLTILPDTTSTASFFSGPEQPPLFSKFYYGNGQQWRAFFFRNATLEQSATNRDQSLCQTYQHGSFAPLPQPR